MSIALFAILGPLAAAGLILVARRAVAPFALLGVATSLVATTITLARVAGGEQFATSLPGLPSLPFRLVVDPLAAVLSTVVAVVATLVIIYAVGYMRGEDGQARFFAAMSFFVAAMQLLVLAGDWVLFLTGWELIALASYLLIGFWFERPGVREAATRAFGTTRAADVGLYIGVFLLASRAGTTEIAETLGLGGASATVAGLLLLLAAIAKSAQVPLQGWLQDAMAGPTPVSALLHSATLVVAGVVLLTRAFPLLTEDVRLTVALIGGTTAIVTGLTAVTQEDFKRMLASSTSSQLGFMLLALGAGSVGAAVFHLITNAATKSGLFLGAGIFQHARGSTSFEKLAGVGRERRRTFLAVVIGALSLAGIPPLAAFWSKDAVIAAALGAPAGWLLTSLAVAGAWLTGIYVARALRILWGDSEEGSAGEAVPGLGWMSVGLAGLTLLTMVLGGIAEPLSDVLDLEIPVNVVGLALGLVAAVAGLAAGWGQLDLRLPQALRMLARHGFRVDGGVVGVVVQPVLALARLCDRLDRGLHTGVLGIGHGGTRLARRAEVLDARVHRVVEAVGALGMATARTTRMIDEAGIDELIRDLVRATRVLGGRARQLQTGLVHRQLLVAAIATVAVVVLLFAS